MSSRFYVIPYFLYINYTKYYTHSESMVIIYTTSECNRAGHLWTCLANSPMVKNMY